MDVIIVGLEFIRLNWAVLVFIAGLVWGAIKLTINTNYVRHDDLAPVQDGLKSTQERLAQIENKVDSLPSSGELTEIKLLMSELRGDNKALDKSIRSLSHQVSLLVEKEIRK
ncbi:DUF2730 family protein [Oligella urethralis]|uniref:DUF2730 family protein n=1 Tax=Oligella urethralis TaxID=90245 RepID=UPI00288948C0|nr:DUF2730 family protein [Oligella urethralis]